MRIKQRQLSVNPAERASAAGGKTAHIKAAFSPQFCPRDSAPSPGSCSSSSATRLDTEVGRAAQCDSSRGRAAEQEQEGGGWALRDAHISGCRTTQGKLSDRCWRMVKYLRWLSFQSLTRVKRAVPQCVRLPKPLKMQTEVKVQDCFCPVTMWKELFFTQHTSRSMCIPAMVVCYPSDILSYCFVQHVFFPTIYPSMHPFIIISPSIYLSLYLSLIHSGGMQPAATRVL